MLRWSEFTTRQYKKKKKKSIGFNHVINFDHLPFDDLHLAVCSLIECLFLLPYFHHSIRGLPKCSDPTLSPILCRALLSQRVYQAVYRKAVPLCLLLLGYPRRNQIPCGRPLMAVFGFHRHRVLLPKCSDPTLSPILCRALLRKHLYQAVYRKATPRCLLKSLLCQIRRTRFTIAIKSAWKHVSKLSDTGQ